MQCYRCEDKELEPTWLASGLAARSCGTCDGVNLDLLTYRAWRESQAATLLPDTPVESVAEGGGVLTCQRCARLMLRYRLSPEHDNYVDLCAMCDQVWLDGGEWELLGSLHLAGQLTEIMTRPWQSKLRTEQAQQRTRAQLEDEVGAEGVARLADFASWYEQLEEKEAAGRFLREHHIP